MTQLPLFQSHLHWLKPAEGRDVSTSFGKGGLMPQLVQYRLRCTEYSNCEEMISKGNSVATLGPESHDVEKRELSK